MNCVLCNLAEAAAVNPNHGGRPGLCAECIEMERELFQDREQAAFEREMQAEADAREADRVGRIDEEDDDYFDPEYLDYQLFDGP